MLDLHSYECKLAVRTVAIFQTLNELHEDIELSDQSRGRLQLTFSHTIILRGNLLKEVPPPGRRLKQPGLQEALEEEARRLLEP